MARFFVDRPVFAWVLALAAMLIGAVSFVSMPVSQYPDIAPTTIRVSAGYPGATAEAVENSVTRVIEDGLTALEGLLYTTSNSNRGSAFLTLVFDGSIEPQDALAEVQTRVRAIEGALPDAVQDRGVNVTRSSSSILMVGAVVSTDGRYDTIRLGDILEATVRGPVQRVEGVGALDIFGSGYAMRIWLDPLRLVQFQLTPTDVTNAVRAQNTTVSVGSLGTSPTVDGQQFTATVTAQSTLTGVDEFEQILLKTEADGATVRLADVARVEIGQQSYGADSRYNGLPAAGFAVNLASGANAVDVAQDVRAALDSLAPALPEGVEFRVAFDTSPFVEQSIQKVYLTLAEAVVLVVLVILVFLQSWRATLIPLVAVPVVLAGTLAVLAAMGYSINTITMFALVLAIGLLVDDAIVVVENVERIIHDEHLPPREATIISMNQITGALIGIAVVLVAVMLPMAFVGGSAGVIYRQFSVTIVTAMILSVLVALILSPAMAATMLKPATGRPNALARGFNAAYDRLAALYLRIAAFFARRPAFAVIAILAISLVAWQAWQRITPSFIPPEDQGVLMTSIRLPEGSTAEQTLALANRVETYLLEEEADAVASVYAAAGFGFQGSSANSATLFVRLKDFSERKGDALSASAVATRANAAFPGDRAGTVTVNEPPAIQGLGNTSGFQMYLLDQAGQGNEALSEATEALVGLAEADPMLTTINARGAEAEAALRIDLDRQKAESLGLPIAEVNAMLATIFSGTNVNDFILNDQIRPVIVQADAPFRMQEADIDGWYARNRQGEMVPFSAFASTGWVAVQPRLSRMDGAAAQQISGAPAPGVSSGQAMARMEELVAQVPGGWGAAWTGISYQERQSSAQAPMLYALSVLVVYLGLAALYESWALPVSVMLSVPIGVLGALLAALWAGQANDVYFKVGILTTIGLAARNAILIVEFARALEREGRSPRAAVMEAARLRLRPILMTSFAFMLGVLPLARATGVGANAQNAIGVVVLGGMAMATLLGGLLVPALYLAVRRLTGRRDLDAPGRVEAAGRGTGSSMPAPAE
ncbi:multidrug efflux RND transporter permease subunit [Paracoccus sp. S-4012]|uniref:multidrug efflux RND transporter permease subunit n=1 Tax=Paracoccus sp. S-4012 TaxID=2665648 RepID=UPI0012AF1192|nr:multidrug efflux RND transporter permease subunit [Paracoccus sp. S-4012]MRX50364.1 multidrug efflux RND transporter permease subunit [Paracoccus sp. S-4012]